MYEDPPPKGADPVRGPDDPDERAHSDGVRLVVTCVVTVDLERQDGHQGRVHPGAGCANVRRR